MYVVVFVAGLFVGAVCGIFGMAAVASGALADRCRRCAARVDQVWRDS